MRNRFPKIKKSPFYCCPSAFSIALGTCSSNRTHLCNILRHPKNRLFISFCAFFSVKAATLLMRVRLLHKYRLGENWVKLVFPTRKPRAAGICFFFFAKMSADVIGKIILPSRCCPLKVWWHRGWKPSTLVRLAMLSYSWKPPYDPKKSNLIRLLCELPWEDLWLPIQCLLQLKIFDR